MSVYGGEGYWDGDFQFERARPTGQRLLDVRSVARASYNAAQALLVTQPPQPGPIQPLPPAPPTPPDITTVGEAFVVAIPAAVWTVTHSLGDTPAVVTVDTASEVMLGDVSYPAPGAVVVTFSMPVAGKLYLFVAEQQPVLTTEPAQGPAEPPAPVDITEVGQAYVVTVAAEVWTVTHSLGDFPVVVTVDTDNQVMLGDVSYPQAGTIVVTFSIPVAGKLYLF